LRSHLLPLSGATAEGYGRWQGWEQLRRREREKGPVLKGVDDEGVALHQPRAESHNAAPHAAARALRARICGCRSCPDVGPGCDSQFMQRAAAVDAAKRALDGPSKVEKDAAEEEGAEGQGRVAVFEGVSDPIIKYCPGRRSFGRCVSLLVLPLSMIPPPPTNWMLQFRAPYRHRKGLYGASVQASKRSVQGPVQASKRSVQGPVQTTERSVHWPRTGIGKVCTGPRTDHTMG
jgi:hypothetical protein